jgi:plastocyanin
MGTSPRHLIPVLAVFTASLMAGCKGYSSNPMYPPAPSPSPSPAIATAFILPDAVSLGDVAFGDEPVVIFKGERLHWVNADAVAHTIVADSPDATDFDTTGELARGGERSFDMTKLGTTRIHCAEHPNMTGTLVVRER